MVRNLGVTLLSIVLALTLCELLLRVTGTDVLPRPDLFELDRDVGKRMRPDWQGNAFDSPVVINSKGLRSAETTYEKPESVYRVLALGDSWTFGSGAHEPDAYPRQLEHVLNERAAERGDLRRFEVINAGVVGYSTDQQAAWLRVEGWKYQPDLVLVNYDPVNDTHDKLARHQRRARIGEIHPWLLAFREAPKAIYLRQVWKRLRRTVQAKYRVASARGDPSAAAEDWTRAYRDGARGWESVRAVLGDIAVLARAHHRPVLLVLLPDVADLARYAERDHPTVEPMVRGAVAEVGLEFFDLEPTFAPWQGNEDEIRLEKHRQPNAKGYSVIARAVSEEIGRRYLGWETPPKALVEMSGIEPPTSALRTQRSPS